MPAKKTATTQHPVEQQTPVAPEQPPTAPKATKPAPVSKPPRIDNVSHAQVARVIRATAASESISTETAADAVLGRLRADALAILEIAGERAGLQKVVDEYFGQPSA
jgi:hypothetical protein